MGRVSLAAPDGARAPTGAAQMEPEPHVSVGRLHRGLAARRHFPARWTIFLAHFQTRPDPGRRCIRIIMARRYPPDQPRGDHETDTGNEMPDSGREAARRWNRDLKLTVKEATGRAQAVADCFKGKAGTPKAPQ